MNAIKQNALPLILLAVSVAVGIFTGMNEAWFDARNFTAGYMAGSLCSAVVLFAVYNSILFIKERKGGSRPSTEA
ncbi:hypothetical protein [Alkalicoccus urumqiensis]|uniref:Uncharacterized protein n=1 Tax=Alkalicoccus urumqiensis TaxID=1548213 RepID=A0A2P6MEM7_ALKUR|nr:hypothetical protein [Alkalicoccus urumqiensis]PRO64721.1 hypothetical protein C6I21_13525 [Alkalicoccus urumqiensis]